VLQVTQHLAEVIGVLETLVYRGKADISDLVELLQLAHHQFADFTRGHFAFAQRQQALTDAVDRGVDQLGRYRAFVQRAAEALAQLGRKNPRACRWS